ncbi:hypothetical protein KZZ52_37215 [Dactylosporangium sp. AC04546]|uniref:hypothetical protein n=1 Tax=Dactylosporangium sp. AC04546 TaxID=2862460 RepID=UPI001EDE8B75|nr:hypothetical protein [Dactylosporangium sp. AC04546]WVK79607.1 hypothetical protein KZZ52_37215 [Dactylosporangium sp. AC04546]
MSLAWRLTATVVAVAGFAGLVVYRFVLQAMFWRIEPASTGTWVGMATFAVALFGPFLGYLWLTRRLLRAPATFQRADDGAAFTVTGSPVLPGFLAIVLMLQAGAAVPYEKVPGTDRIGLPADPALQAFIALPALLVLVALAVLWLPGAGLRLSPAGITVRHAFRAHEIGWDALLPGGPAPVRRWTMRLRYRGPGGDPRSCSVPAFWLSVDGIFLATVVRHYAERPEHRAAIGTEVELDRLRSGFRRRASQPLV